MFTILGTLISGVLSGGATGLLGVALQRAFDLWGRSKDIEMLKLQHVQALALAEIESRRADRRAEADEHAADRAAEAVEAEADSKSLVASYSHDEAKYLDKSAQKNKFAIIAFTIVDFVRGLIRPVLTAYLVVLTTMLFLWARELAGGHPMTADQALTIIGQIIATILYLTVACTLWWFGSRPPKKDKQ